MNYHLHTRMFSFCAVFGLLIGQVTESLAETDVARGVVKASSRVDVSTDIVAPIEEVPFLAGAQFSKGDLLIKFDCGRYAADLRAAKASANAAYVEFKQKRYLFKNGAGGKSEMDLASANSARSAAEIEAIKERMRSCSVIAPFDGRVVEVNARASEMPQGSEPLLTILDDSRIEIELVVPSLWLRHVKIGTEFKFLVDETGRAHIAKIERLGAEVDPVSQTIQLYASFTDDRLSVLAGMSGDAYFDVDGNIKTGAVE